MTTDKQTSINLALSTINGKWKLSLMDELFQGTKRNGELMRALDGITQRVLTDRLREMEKDGLVHRESFNELPPSCGIYAHSGRICSLRCPLFTLPLGRNICTKKGET